MISQLKERQSLQQQIKALRSENAESVLSLHRQAAHFRQMAAQQRKVSGVHSANQHAASLAQAADEKRTPGGDPRERRQPVVLVRSRMPGAADIEI